MTLTPPPPADLHGLVAAYADTSGSVLALAEGLGPGEEDLPTDCPGWTVLDQVRHVLSVEGMLLGEPMPDVDVTGHAHVRHDFGALVEKYLEGRRGRSADRVVEELRTTREARLAALTAPGLTLESPADGPFGRTSLGALLELRTFDIWTHEQDLREALDRPGGLGTAAASVALARTLQALPKAIAASGAVRAGDTTAVTVTGPVSASSVLGWHEVDGRLRGLPADGSAVPVDALRVEADTRAFARLTAGRWTAERFAEQARLGGDAEALARLLPALAITP